ncbi:beta-ketoacyl synthase N-terminal-like domain-containing protein [Rhizobium lusitanum]|uniref:beta-ketoacyl synthase N-terminal-like domain-containing protein n=1 Tax=Rhizobium lusitanum TaxID=293958 RepID=UPI003F4ACB70
MIGMAGRFPDADTVDELWMLLSDGRNAIMDIPETRWNWRDYFIAPGDPDNKITTNRGGFIRDIERFDALFFDISPREAQDMDPAQQLLLMESYRAIEDAGLSPQSIRGSRTAVFVGMEESQHEMLNGWRGITTGGAAMIASRLSYFLDLHGPAIVTNTACSSGLVALHQAAMSLRQGECDTALVASVALTLSPYSYITMSRAGMLSPEGQCRSFAANADGIGVGEAVVVLVLKPLAAAVAEGNPIHGVLKASGINFDGKTNGVTAPNGKMQAELIERIYTDHKIDINDIGHIVAHGTGTKLGDPVEVNALHDAFKKLRDRQPDLKSERSNCAITSCKANLGHTMAASGLVSLVSLLQSIRHQQIPASLHCEEENPHFNRTDVSLYVNRSRRKWQRTAGKPRIGAVSAFGRSGTNAHVVIEEYLPAENILESGSWRSQHTEVAIALSARTADQLRQKVRDLLRLTDRLGAGGDDGNEMRLTDVAYTLQTGRDAMAYRLGFIVGSFGELQVKLRAYLDDAQDIGNLFRGDAKPDPQYVRALARDKDRMAAAKEWLVAKRLPELLGLWVKGFDVDWQRLYGDDRPRRVSLPAYPFVGEAYRLRNVPESRAYATRGAEQDDAFGRSKAIMPSPSGKSAVASGQPPLVVIGGAGLFGLCMGVFLKKANIPFRIIEKNEDVGGVWFVNRWPGCGCDIPMLAYAYSFEHFTGDIWAKQPDILKYLQGIARKYDLYSHISFNTKIREASWQEEAGQWLLTSENEETIAAKYYIHAANEGQGHVGNIPNIPGMDEFQGFLMHALDCRADDWDFAGKRIAIIGNGTTQIQLVETLQPVAERLVVYARSPKYIYPRATYGRKTQEKLGSDYQFWLKHRGEYLAGADEFYAISNDPVQINPFHPDTQVERYFSRDMNDDWRSFYQWLREIDMVPDYSPGCSRPCMSHTYHHQIRADNVELKTVPAARITATGIETEKDAEAFDIILLATGYDLHDFKPRITIRGRNRLELNEYFGDFPKSHAGIAVSHFPNFFLASGPNSGTNATSITAIYEHSCENFLEIIRYCEANHVTSVEAKEAEAEKFVAFVRERNQLGSFSSGCSSWYQTKQGENVAVFPGTFEELKQWRTFNPEQYHFEYADNGLARDIAGYSARQPALESRSPTAEPIPQPTLEMPEDRRGRRERLDSPAVTEQMMADHVQGIITEKLSAALEIDPDLIDYDASFADYGIDSILGAELVQSVNAILEVKLETNHLFDYGSVKKLSGHVLSVWGAAVRARLTETRYTAEQMKAKDIPAPAGEVVDLKRPALSAVSMPTPDRTHGFGHDPIAIIGMSGRFADSESLDSFWQNLRDGKDLVKEISRWDKTECISPGSTETTYCSRGSFVESVDLFDPAFFRISPLEAMYMDPQQRIFLEECWTALEYAGYAGKGMDKKRCGVFAGCSRSEYAQFFSEEPPAQAFWGNAPSIIPARIAYYLNLLGPAISVDTACSSSLVSIHLACQSLWSRETDMSLAGGVFLQLKPDYHQVTNRAGMLSLEGKCRAFDAGANGFVPGEGVGVVVLKRLQDALEDGDTIHGVIAGSGMNQDGSTNGITAPSAQSQQRLELSVYEQFQINPETIQLVEAHGTGTPMGDPVEFKALTDAFRHYTDKTQYCAIGSVKANIGHATLAAGIASVLKVLMALKHRQIPALLHFQEANPAIDFPSSPFYPCTELSDWHVADDQRRRAAISSFGISGTNAHMVIEEMPEARPAPSNPPVIWWCFPREPQNS